MRLEGLRRIGRDVDKLKDDCRSRGLTDDDAARLFRDQVPEDAVVVFYGAGVDVPCLKWIYGSLRGPLICNAETFLPKNFMGHSSKGKPIYQSYGLKDHASFCRVADLANGAWHNASMDARVLAAVVGKMGTEGWVAHRL